MHHDRQCNETVEKAEMQANIAKCFQGSLLFLPLHSYKMWLIKFLMPPMPKQVALNGFICSCHPLPLIAMYWSFLHKFTCQIGRRCHVL